MKENHKTEIEVIDFFRTALREENNYIIITQFPVGDFPEIGDFLTFANEDCWQISGIVTVAIDEQGKEMMAERQLENIWDIEIQPLSNMNDIPQKGPAVITSKLPLSLIKNKN